MTQQRDALDVVDTARVGAVVVTFNSSQDISACLSSLEAAGTDGIVVLDNGSTPESRTSTRQVCESFARVEYVQREVNIGFGPGVNAAVEVLRRSLDADSLLWIVNPDTVVDPDSLTGLVAAVVREGFDVVSPVLSTQGRAAQPTVWFAGGDLDFGAVRTVHRSLGVPMASLKVPKRECSFITGAATFMSLRTWDRLGGYSADYFLYWEDADLSFRATELGLKLGVVPSSHVWHSVGGSGDRTGKSATYFYYMQRNRILFARKARVMRRLLLPAAIVETLRLTARPLRQESRPMRKFVSGLSGAAAGYVGGALTLVRMK